MKQDVSRILVYFYGLQTKLHLYVYSLKQHNRILEASSSRLNKIPNSADISLKYETKCIIKIAFLGYSGKAFALKYFKSNHIVLCKDDVLTVPHPAILSRVSPITAKGRTYALTEIEMVEATMCLK